MVSVYLSQYSEATERARRAEARFRNMARKRADLTSVHRRHHAENLDMLDEMLFAAEREIRNADVDRKEARQLWWSTMSAFRSHIRTIRTRVQSPFLAEYGLRVAVISGPIGVASQDAGIALHAKFPERISDLSTYMQETLYHAIHEAAFQLLALGTPDRLIVRMRSGERELRTWVAVTVATTVKNIPTSAVMGDEDTFDRAVMDLGQIARAFDGECRAFGEGQRHSISMILFQDAAEVISPPQLKRAGSR
jgi:hypothetical protein